MRWERCRYLLWEEKSRGQERDFSIPGSFLLLCSAQREQEHPKRLEKKQEEKRHKGRRTKRGKGDTLCQKTRLAQGGKPKFVCCPCCLLLFYKNTVKFIRIKMKSHLLPKEWVVSPLESPWVHKPHSRAVCMATVDGGHKRSSIDFVETFCLMWLCLGIFCLLDFLFMFLWFYLCLGAVSCIFFFLLFFFILVCLFVCFLKKDHLELGGDRKSVV